MKTLLECLKDSLNEALTVSYTYAAEDYLLDELSMDAVDLPFTFISISNQELDGGPNSTFRDTDGKKVYSIKDLSSKDVNICLDEKICDFNKNTIKCKTLVITSRGPGYNCNTIKDLNIDCKVLYLLPNLLEVKGDFTMDKCNIKCDKMYTCTASDSIINFTKSRVQCKEVEVLALREPYDDIDMVYGIADTEDMFFDQEVEFDPVEILTLDKFKGLDKVIVGDIILTQDDYDFDPDAGEQGGTGYDGKMGNWVWNRND